MAFPSYFAPVKIGLRLRQQSFIGGVLGTNNPTRELLNEASAVFGKERRVAQIISIGSGLPRVLSVELPEDEKPDHRLLADVMADCETVARELASRLYNVDAYLRLNVDRGVEAITMSDWNELGVVESHTNAYIRTAAVTQALDASLRRLRERVGVATLVQLSEHILPNFNRTVHLKLVAAQSGSIKITAKTAPPVSPYFVLRVKEWEKLVRHLVTSPLPRQMILPITGMGGCGKTQLVSFFLQEYPSLYVPCRNLSLFLTSPGSNTSRMWMQVHCPASKPIFRRGPESLEMGMGTTHGKMQSEFSPVLLGMIDGD
jgi:hypothetical protein